MTPFKWMRLARYFTSARSVAVAFGLLLCSAALLYVGYVKWNLSWLGSIAATVIIASVTTVIIDRLIVRYQRIRLLATLESGRRRLEDSCKDLIKAVNDVGSEVDQAFPKSPYWIAAGGYTPAGVDDSWRFWVERLNAAVNAWSALTGYGLRSAHINAVNDSLANVRDAYTEALDMFKQLAAHMKSKEPPFNLFGDPLPPPQPDKEVLKAAEAAAIKVTRMSDEAVGTIEVVKTTAAKDDLQARTARRHPFRLPPWLQFATVAVAVAWIFAVVAAQVFPAAFPHGFVEDNLLDIAASSAIALFAGALTITLVQGRRIVVGKNTFPFYSALSMICGDITLKTRPDEPDLRRMLAEKADDIADLAVAIQNESPSAELAFWTRIVTDKMRRLAADEAPFFISEADAADKFATLFRPTGNPDLDADTQTVMARHRAGASTQPSAPVPELVNLLEDLNELTEAARAAAQGQGT